MVGATVLGATVVGVVTVGVAVEGVADVGAPVDVADNVYPQEFMPPLDNIVFSIHPIYLATFVYMSKAPS